MKPLAHRCCTAVPLLLIGWFLSSSALVGEEPSARTLMEASRLGDLETVLAELDAGVDIDAQDGSRFTALVHALDSGQEEVAKALVERGAAFDQMVSLYQYPLNVAIRGSNNETIAYLIEEGAPLNPEDYPDTRGRSPLFTALIWGDAELLRILQENGADWLDWRDDDRDALSTAAQFNNFEAVRYLLELGADVNQRAPGGNFPLAMAAFESHLDMVELLLANRADVSAVSRGKMNVNRNPRENHTALVAAVRDNNLDIVNVLLDAGANPSQLDNLAIKYADFAGNQAIYDRLLEAGAPEPEPYSFTDIDIFQHTWIQQILSIDGEDPVEWADLSVLNNPSLAAEEKPARYDGLPVTVAVVPTLAELESAEILLTSELTGEPNLKLVERAQLQKALDEVALGRAGFLSAGNSIRAGQLSGADCLILLDQEGDTPEARIISTATGLVLRVLPGDPAELEDWIRRIRQALLTEAPLLHRGTEGLTLVSIPRITSTMGGADAIDQERVLSRALALYLGSLDGVFVLDRRNMLQLAGEKMLTEDARNFYSSGWLVDGGFDDVGEELSITLRLRQPQEGKETIIEARGDINQPRDILGSLRNQVGEALGSSVSASQETISEADLYLAEARKAYDLRQWESAQHAADAAWALGGRLDEATSLRLLTRLQRLYLANFLLKDKAEGLRWGGAVQAMAYRAPLLMAREDPQELTADQFLTLANDIMAIYRPLVAKEGDFTSSEKDLLMFYSEAIKGAILPLEFLNMISDRKRHEAKLEPLRNEVMQTTLALLSVAKEKDFPYLYQTVFSSYLQVLPYLLRDEDLLYEELEVRLNEASAMEAPLTKHSVYGSLHEVMRDKMNAVGGQPETAWQRMAQRMIESDNPDARYLGHSLMREDRHDYQGRVADCEAMVPLYFQLVAEDDSLLGNTIPYFEPEIDRDLRPENTFRIYPEFATRMWYPDPYDLQYFSGNKHGIYRPSWYPPGESDNVYFPRHMNAQYEMILARLQSAAKFGSSAVSTHHYRIYNTISLEKLEGIHQIAQQSLIKLAERSRGMEYLDETVRRYNNYLVKPISEIYLKAKQEERLLALKNEEIQRVGLPAFQMPLIEDFHESVNEGQNQADFGEPYFYLDAYVPADAGFWLMDTKFGLFHYDLAVQSITTAILLPNGTRSRPYADFLDDRFFAASLYDKDQHESVGIGVFDRKQKNWRILLPERASDLSYRSRSGVVTIVILENDLFYSFLSLPDGIRDIFDPRSSSGVARIHLPTGEETLLASSNRTPALNPADNVQPKNYYFYRIASVKGEVLRINQFIFDPETDEWRKRERNGSGKKGDAYNSNISTADYIIRKLRYNETERTISMLVDSLFGNENDFSFRFDLALELTNWENLRIPDEYPELQSFYAKNLEDPSFRIKSAGKGIILHNRLGFYFIDFERFRPEIEERINYLMSE